MSKIIFSLLLALSAVSAFADAGNDPVLNAAVKACNYEMRSESWCNTPVGYYILMDKTESDVSLQEYAVDFEMPEAGNHYGASYRANVVVVDGKIAGVEFHNTSGWK